MHPGERMPAKTTLVSTFGRPVFQGAVALAALVVSLAIPIVERIWPKDEAAPAATKTADAMVSQVPPATSSGAPQTPLFNAHGKEGGIDAKIDKTGDGAIRQTVIETQGETSIHINRLGNGEAVQAVGPAVPGTAPAPVSATMTQIGDGDQKQRISTTGNGPVRANIQSYGAGGVEQVIGRPMPAAPVKPPSAAPGS